MQQHNLSPRSGSERCEPYERSPPLSGLPGVINHYGVRNVHDVHDVHTKPPSTGMVGNGREKVQDPGVNPLWYGAPQRYASDPRGPRRAADDMAGRAVGGSLPNCCPVGCK